MILMFEYRVQLKIKEKFNRIIDVAWRRLKRILLKNYNRVNSLLIQIYLKMEGIPQVSEVFYNEIL